MAKTTLDYIRTLGDKILEGKDFPARKGLALTLWNAALSGDLRAAKLILDYDLPGEEETVLTIEAWRKQAKERREQVEGDTC